MEIMRGFDIPAPGSYAAVNLADLDNEVSNVRWIVRRKNGKENTCHGCKTWPGRP
jgi:hypothetical protein